MKTLKKGDAKAILIDAIYFTDSVDENDKPIRRNEFPREHLRNVKKIIEILMKDVSVHALYEDGSTKEFTSEEFKNLGKEELEKVKRTAESIKDGEIIFDERLFKTAKYFLSLKSHWKMVSDEALDELDEFIGGEK